MKTMEADVIVVAAGPAGLAAAITAGENDLKAIVFEKSNTKMCIRDRIICIRSLITAPLRGRIMCILF